VADPPKGTRPGLKTQQDLNKLIADDKKRLAAENAPYLNMLDDMDARQRYFKALAEPSASDHGEISKVKNKIGKLIE